jgi:hypothetical protein
VALAGKEIKKLFANISDFHVWATFLNKAACGFLSSLRL